MPHQKSGHWQYFAALNDARPGAGFDVDYLRAGPIKAFITNVLMRLRGRDPNRHRNVFRELWPNGPITWRCVRRVGGSPVAYLAANYANTILETMPKIGIVNPDRAVFLEIGGGQAT